MSGFSLAGIIKLLEKANDQEVNISFREEELSVHVQKGKKIDTSLLDELRINKPFLIHYFKNFAHVEQTADVLPIQKIDRNEIKRIPLSFAQERLWFIHQLEGSVQYHLPTVLRIKGKLNSDILMQAFQEIVNRHEVLRTVILEENGRGFQHIKDGYEWRLKFVDGSVYKEDRQALRDFIKQLISEPFDLSRDDMLRAVLIDIDEEEHVLVVIMHHIASDAWSQSILVKEVMELYSAYGDGRINNLPPVDIQYADYAYWQRNYLQGEVLDKKLEYWKNKLDGLETLQLATDYGRPVVQSAKGDNFNFSIGKGLSDQLYKLCQQQGVSLFMGLLSVYKVLLYRYSAQHDISVGTSIASRQQKEIEGLVGFFVNTLALRDLLNPQASFTDLLQQVKTTTLEAYQHQDLPFEKVVETVVKEREPGRNPLFQVMLVLANTPQASRLQLGELQLSHEGYEQQTAKFDITFFLTETPEGLHGSVQYATDLYHQDTISRMTAHFVTLIASVVKDPQQKVALLPMLTAPEEQQLLRTFNDSHVAYPRHKSITALFEEQVIKTPDHTALVFEGQSLTYTQLNERSNQLAHYLKSRGVQPDSPVPMYVERSATMLIAMLGILKAGAAYVPIDTDLPADRISYMLADIGARILVSSSTASVQLEVEAGVEIVEADTVYEISLQPTVNVVTQPLAHHLAYVIYTSGSTGRPKGVMIEHRSLVDYYYGLNKHTQIEQCRSFALVSTIATDLGSTVIYASLLSGGALHVFSKALVSNAAYLQRYFREQDIDCVKIVPSHWKALSGEEGLLLPAKLIVFGGEALQAEVIEAIRLSGSRCQVVNHYGPTETTIGKLLHVVKGPQEVVYNKPIPVGRPFSNTRVYVLSREMQLCPVGVPGQLYIAGDGLARGYLNNEVLTKQKFITDPFIQESTALMYGTGDLVKWQEDGNITFIGRADDQVKIRGYRVEPGEIESVLQQSELVKQAVVLAREDKQGEKRLVAYIVAPEEEGFDKEGIAAYLREHLPEYMVPGVLMELASIPLTANGKVDRKALPEVDASESISGGYVAPRSETEARLAAIWQEVLEVDEVGINDDFFELGGHSLLAVRLISAIRKGFEVEMPIGDIFDYPTVSQLAGRLVQPSQEILLPSITAVHPRPQRIPLSFSQERLWFIDQFSGSLHYHVPSVVRLKGRLDKQALAYALQQIINRHEVLRTVIGEEEGQPYQLIKEAAGWQLQMVDGSIYKEDDKGLQQYLQQYISLPFDLGKDYLVRAALISVEEQQDHVLAVVLHHIASDGYSTSIMVRELTELYQASVEHREASLAVLPVQYADYALWQRNYMQGAVWEEKLGYWKEKLQGVAALQLPTDYPRPQVQSTRGAISSFNIDKKLSEALQHLSRQQGVTLFMTMLAGVKVLLYRYSGQQDISVGTPTAGRQQQELEGLIGFFINPLVLRSEVAGSSSFVELLQQVRATTLQAYEHQDVPFERVVESVVKERDMSRSALFQVMLILQNTPEAGDLRLGEVSLSHQPTGSLGHTTSKFDLTFNVVEHTSGIQIGIEYVTDLYKAATIERMGTHLRELLQSVVATPQESIGSLRLLSIREEEQLLEAFNDTTAVYPKDRTLVDLFEEQASKTPEHTALIFDEVELSYQELNERSNQLAHYLRSRGVKEETLVPVCIERSAEMVIAILGVLKAGAAYVPIDPAYPEDRIQFMLEDTAAGIVVSSNKSRQKIQTEAEVEIIELDNKLSDLGNQPASNLTNQILPNQLAYVIYTSGSTGKPKGVMIEHTSIVNLLISVADKVHFNAASAFMSVTTFSFDICYLELFMPLVMGGKLIIVQREATQDGFKLSENIKKYRPTHMQGTPSTWQLLMDAEWQNNEDVKMLVGGEAFKEDLKTELTQKGNVWNVYGPTETTIWSTIKKLETSESVLIGKPISNTKIAILNNNTQLCPIGVEGEIYIGGIGLARGYFNREQLTAEKFIKDPYSEEPGKRLYRTGDIGRWLPDGNIEYRGRMDEQVKVRGFRIELGEIETVLQECKLVKQAVVLAKEDKQFNRQLVSYIVPHGLFNREGMIDYLKAKLPAYMVPALWVEMESLPLTPNGKINRKALPDPEISALIEKNYAAPTNEMEKVLVKIWQDLLGVERVGIHDNFFELGGHSLLAMRLVSLIRKEMNVEVAIRNVFDYSTIAELAHHITQSKGLLLPVIEAVRSRPEYTPLSFSQERIWFIDQLGGSLQYHLPAVLRLKGNLNKEALSNALQQIVNRHEVLRTVIRENDGINYQFIKARDNWKLQVVDGSIYKEDVVGLQQYIKKCVDLPFNLSADDMLRATLISLEEDDHIIVVVLHHIASDAWSNAVIVQELAELYTAYVEQRTDSLLPLPIQYADYAMWQRRYLQGEVWDKKLEYWKDKLEGVAPLQLPTDYPRPLIQSTNGALTGFRINKELSDQLQLLSQQQGVTLYMTLLAAFNVLLYRYSGQQDICVGSPIAGRQQQELEGLIGFFINTLALRSEVKGTASFLELLQQVRATTLEAYEQQDVPFEKVVEAVVKERNMSRSPLFQIMLALQNVPETGNLHLGDVQVSRGIGAGSLAHTTSKFEITFNVAESENGLYVSVEYCTDLYKESTIEKMSAHFTALLYSAVKTPEQSIGLLPMLSSGEEQQLLVEFNDTQTVYPFSKSVITLFKEQVAKTPEAKAVIFEEDVLTYRQLDERSNQLANYLIEKGIQPGDHVGLLSLRGLKMIIGIFGILKSGAAYVPFNTEYPAERLQYIVEDSAIKHIVYTDFTLLNSSGLKDYECIDVNESAHYPANAVSIEVEADSPVYIMYTSGTTGRPKGIAVCNRNIIKLVYEPADIAVKQEDRMLQWSNYAFDGSAYEIYCSLLKGAGLYLIKEEWASDVYELGRLMKEQEITVCFLTTALFNTFIDVDPGMLKGVRKVLFGGEMVSPSHVRKALRIIGPGKIIHVYGPTETTTYATYCPLDVLREDNIIPIGKPLANTKIYVLDGNRQFVPPGVQGELYIGGDGVSLGYVNNEVLNAEKFVYIPIGNKEERLYRTGDLVRWMDDGYIDYIGRIDNQVKIRGYRIEPGEIENVLQESDMVSKAVVMVKENSEGSKSLVSYIVSAGSYDKQKLISWLQVRLPHYMVPALWVEMDSFPLNPNGKIDKNALPDPDISQLSGNQYEAPRNELELRLAEIWQNLLGIKKAGIHDNFFELGGDSILTIQVVNRAKRLGYDLQPRDIFTHQTIARLSEAISNRSTLVVSGEQGLLTGTSGLLPIQQWYLEESGKSVSHFNQTVLLGIDKAVSYTVLNTALEQLLSHHDALRFRYYQKENEWYQEYGSHLSALIVDDLRTVKNDILGTVITQKANSYQRSLDIKKGELIRMVWMQTPDAEKQNRLLIVIHHLVVDGVSWRILIENLEFLLTGLQTNQVVSLGTKSSSYRQWYQALKQYGQRQSVLSQINYWERVLSSYQPLLTDKKHIEKAGLKDISSLVMTLGSVETNQLLHEVPKTYHTEINDILLCALTMALRDWGGIDKVTIGLEGHGREEIAKNIDTSQTVGWFTSLYPVLIKMGKEQQAGEAIKSVKEQLRLVPDKGLGFGVLKYINEEKKLAVKPRWNIVFNYLGQLDNVVQQGKWFAGARESAGQSVSEEQLINEQLSVNGSVKGGQLVLIWSYNTRNFEEKAINELVKIYQANLEILIAHCIEQQKYGVVLTPSDYGTTPVTPLYEIDDTTSPEINYKYLVPIKTNGNKIPLYIVAGGGATAHKFMKFAKMMDSDQPVYILQAPDESEQLKEFPDTIEKIATTFLEEVITDNPKGPYALSGHCTGGLIAYEMARQLKARGKKIHLLALFDTIAPRKDKPQPANIKNLYYIPIYLKTAISKTITKVDFEMFLLRKYTRSAIGYKINSLKNLMRKSRKVISVDKLNYTGIEIYDETSDIYVAAHKKYQVIPYDGDIATFYARERYFFFDREKNISYKQWNLGEATKNSWKAYAASTSVYEIKGEHSDIFESLHGEEFAQTLQKLLDNS